MTITEIVKELRIEAGINSLCGSKEWTDLLNGAADVIEQREGQMEAMRGALESVDLLPTEPEEWKRKVYKALQRLASSEPVQEVGALAQAPGSAQAVRAQLLYRISSELDRAYAKHGRGQWGRHEFCAILKEEVDELWDAIKTDAPQPHVIEEAMQVAAMVFRYYETGDRYRETNPNPTPSANDTKL